MDRHRSSLPPDREAHQSNGKIDGTAEGKCPQKVTAAGLVDIIALVRSLQRTAGMTDCFRSGNLDCDIADCDWRTYCLSTPGDVIESPRRPNPKSD